MTNQKPTSSDADSRWSITLSSRTKRIFRVCFFVVMLVLSVPAMSLGPLGSIDQLDALDPIQEVEAQSSETTEENGTIYVGSDTGDLYAIDAKTGDQIWKNSIAGDIQSAPLVKNGTVYVAPFNTDTFYAIDADTGEHVWNYSTDGLLSDPAPVFADGKVYVGYYDNQMHAIDEVTGEREWVYNVSSSDYKPAPGVSNGTIYFNDPGNKYVVAVNTSDGTERWKTSTSGTPGKMVTYWNGMVYTGTDDGTIYELNATSGNVSWSYSSGSEMTSAPAVANGRVYVGLKNNNLTAINSESGDLAWKFTGSSDWPSQGIIPANGMVYFGSQDGNFYAVDNDTGNEQWSVNTGAVYSASTYDSGSIYVAAGGSDTLYSLDSDNGDVQWSTDGLGMWTSSPTYVSPDALHSTGLRVKMGIVGDIAGPLRFSNQNSSLSGNITGTVTDQDGNPVPKATVNAWGVHEQNFENATEPNLSDELNRSKLEQLELKAENKEELLDELQSFEIGGVYDPQYDLESHYESADANYALVHDEDEWGTDRWANDITSESLGEPTTQVDSGDDVIISVWDPTETGGLLGQNQVENSFPGSMTKEDVYIAQYGPTGEIIDQEKYDPEVIAETGSDTLTQDPTQHYGVRTQLTPGVYSVYTPGGTGYTFVVGDYQDIKNGWQEDLRIKKQDAEEQLEDAESEIAEIQQKLEEKENQLSQRAKQVQELQNVSVLVRKTVQTNQNGEFAVNFSENVSPVKLQAMKLDGSHLSNLEDPSMQDLRDYSNDGYNGTFYLPTPTPLSVKPPEDDVEVDTYRSPAVPYQDIGSLGTLMEWIREEREEESIEDLKNQYNERLEEMNRSRLLTLYETHRLLVETTPGAKTEYLNLSEFDTIQDSQDLSNPQLRNETDYMQSALENTSSVPPPRYDDPVGGGEDSPISITDGKLNAEYALPESIDPESVTPEIHWSNGSSEVIADQYWHIDTGLIGNDKLIISDYPLADSDPGAFTVRILGGGSEGVLDDTIPVKNPAYGGSVPDINAIDFSTTAPGPDERVYVHLRPAKESGFNQLVKAEAWNANDKRVDTYTVNGSANAAYFNTNGEGAHQIRLTFKNTQGDAFVISERLDAKEVSRSEPATIRASQSALGVHAVTGEELHSARIESQGATLQIDAIADSSDGPGQLNLEPSNVMDGDEHRLELNVLHGSDEQRVQSHVPVAIHLEDMDSDTLFWRSGPGFTGEPISWDGSTRYGVVEEHNDGEKLIVRTYTREDGTLEVTAVESPGILDRMRHRVAQMFGSIPVVGGILSPSDFAIPAGMALGITIPAGLAVRRRAIQ